MKVQHLTAGGSAVIRDTADIELTTLRRLEAFRLPVPFAGTVEVEEIKGLTFKVTLMEEGAMFDVQKAGQPAFMNACSFAEGQTEEILGLVRGLARQLPFGPDVIRKPDLPNFLYTVPVAFFLLTPQEMQLAGEIEFYIYYNLYLSWKKSRK